MLLGIASLRAGGKIHYDAANMKVTTPSSANAFLSREYPQGWTLDSVATVGSTDWSRSKPASPDASGAPMPTMNRAPLFIVGFASLARPDAPGSDAQQPPAGATAAQPISQLPTFRTGANIVRVDVTVLDHRGNPVPALKAEDFLIDEDGVPQKVTLTEVHRGELVNLTTTCRSRSARRSTPRQKPRETTCASSSSSGTSTASTSSRAHPRARGPDRFVSTAFQPTDLVALMDQLTPTDAIRFTRDFKDLALDVKKLQRPAGRLRSDAQRGRGRAADARRRYPAAASGGDGVGLEVGGRVPRDAARGPEVGDFRQRRR